jgi:hypothetical protein
VRPWSEGLAMPLPTDACVPIHDLKLHPETRCPAPLHSLEKLE